MYKVKELDGDERRSSQISGRLRGEPPPRLLASVLSAPNRVWPASLLVKIDPRRGTCCLKPSLQSSVVSPQNRDLDWNLPGLVCQSCSVCTHFEGMPHPPCAQGSMH